MIRWFESRNKLSWFITLLIAIAIFYVSSLTFPPASPTATGIKAILYHIMTFFLLSLFLTISLVKGKNKPLLVFSILIAFTYALTDEFHQLFVTGRDGSISDVLLDTTGIIFSILIYTISLELRTTQQK